MQRFKRQGSGHIVNIASVAGKGGFPGGATYCATKHGVVGYSEAVRFELREHRRRGLLRHAGHRQHRARGGPQGRALSSRRSRRRTSRTRSSARSSSPYFDVFVPKSTGPSASSWPSGRAACARRSPCFLKADRVLIDAAHGRERAAYEKRAAESTPAAEEKAGGEGAA